MTRWQRNRRKSRAGALTVVGYARVSTEEQAMSGVGLLAQRAAVAAEVERRGWQLLTIHEDAGYSGKSVNGRPALAVALEQLATGEADCLVVARLDRLSRRLVDAAHILERATAEGWRFVSLDLGVDMTTPEGEMMAHIMASFAQFERKLIGQRTKDALAQVKARGVRLGRPRQLAPEVLHRISDDRDAGLTLQGITDRLTADNVPTAQGGAAWYPATVAAVLRSIALDADYRAA
jgi:DNA invertase Pin-like site-specific DNA recombinase